MKDEEKNLTPKELEICYSQYDNINQRYDNDEYKFPNSVVDSNALMGIKNINTKNGNKRITIERTVCKVYSFPYFSFSCLSLLGEKISLTFLGIFQ